MTFTERLHRWNQWYDGLPQEWRFQVILWPLIALGACNMLLSFSNRFPFGLLVLLGMLCVAAIRVPYVLGWIADAEAPASGGPGTRRLEIGGAGADWLVGLNRRYEAMPEERRFWVFPAILVIAGAFNMQLTINKGYPFGLIFLIVLLAIIVMRAPYAHGLLRSSSAGTPPAALQYNARITDGARITDEHSPIPANAHADEAAPSPASIMPAAPGPQHEMRTVEPNEAAAPAVDVGPTSQPGHRHDISAAVSPTVPPQPEPAQEPDGAGAANPLTPSHSHAPGPRSAD